MHAHDHEHDEGAVPHTHVRSVGIDIGSSTCHLMFSLLTVGYPSPHHRRPEILARTVVSRSPVLLTPFSASWSIDSGPISALVGDAFEAAGLRASDVDTGAVIVTGEAARRDNAQRIAELFSEQTGNFVCATAGPRLEAILAAHGSGAVARSLDEGSTLLHVDVGGGTTKINLVVRGKVVGTTAVNIGARLVAFDEDGRLVRIERGGDRFLWSLGLELRIGDRLDRADAQRLSTRMASVLFDVLQGASTPWADLHILAPLDRAPEVRRLVFSGGVAEYIYARHAVDYGDLGPQLGGAIRAEAAARGYDLLPAGEAIRATVIGASGYSVQLSGETVHVPDPGALPLHNLRTFVVEVTWERPVVERVQDAVLAAILSRDSEVVGNPFALVVATPRFIGYGVVHELAEGIRRALETVGREHRPHLLVFEQNIGQVVGGALAPNLSLTCIDEVKLSELDFIDVGRMVDGEAYVPVVVKSLAFGA